MSLKPQDWIAGLEKGLAVIEAFDAAHPRLTATEAGLRCGMTRTAARRHLKTLAHLGYVGSDGKLYWLMPRILRLGHAYLESARLPRLVQPVLQRIAEGTGETAYLGVLDGQDSVFIARSGAQQRVEAGYAAGTRLPAQVTAVGMAILAAMTDAETQAWIAVCEPRPFTSFTFADRGELHRAVARFRQLGWAVSEQQLERNYRGIAVPLLDLGNNVHGAISITMPINQEETDHAIRRVLPVMQEAAKGLRPLL